MLADLYCRKSTDDDGRSVARQDDACRAAVVANGWEVGRFFADDGLSASRFARRGRAEYEALLEHIRSGNCRILVLWESSRGSRREVIWFALLELCREQGTQIHIVTHHQTYDLTNRRHWKALADEGVDSADESNKISERSQDGKRSIAAQGKPAGKLLYGYMRLYDPETGAYQKQIEHPEQAPIVRRIAEGVAAGRSSASIARQLNAAGVPRPSGAGQWRGRDIARYATQPAYVRRRVHRGEVLPDVVADWPAILDENVWEKCCALLAVPGRLTHDGTDMRWFLTGVARCGREGCDGVLRPHRGAGKRRYTCSTCWSLSVAGADLDDYVALVVHIKLERPGSAAVFRPRSDNAQVQLAEESADELRVRLREYRALGKAGKISPASFADFEADLLPRIAAAEAKVRTLSAPPPLPELDGLDGPAIAARWDRMKPALQRRVVEALMRITVLPAAKRGAPFTPDRVQIDWKGATA